MVALTAVEMQGTFSSVQTTAQRHSKNKSTFQESNISKIKVPQFVPLRKCHKRKRDEGILRGIIDHLWEINLRNQLE